MDEVAGVGEDRAGTGSTSIVQSGCTKPVRCPGGGGEGIDGTGEEEPSELIYFKVYKSQIPVIEQAIETAAVMLGTDKSRGYCLEMICADFLAGANLDNGDPQMLLRSITRFFRFLKGEQRQEFLSNLREQLS